jgi:surface protein
MLKFNNRVLNYNTRWLNEGSQPGPSVPSYTIRLRYTDGVTPTFNKGTAVQVSSSPNIWDLTYNNSDWSSLLTGHADLLEVIYANTNGVTHMGGMFASCVYLTNVCYINTSTVTDMTELFAGCLRLTNIPSINTESATTMQGMFYYCTGMTTIPTLNTSNVTNMDAMFYASAITNIPMLDTSKVTNMHAMFALSNIANVPLLDTSSVTNADGMFYNCSNLRNIPLFNTSNMVDMDGMFSDCYNVESGALALYNQASAQTVSGRTHVETFYDCGRDTTTGAAELAQIDSEWK